nr:YrhC family protein [Pullulanibacillus pueri]
MQKLKTKIIDYKRFSFIFLYLAAFLYMGSLIPFEGKTLIKSEILMGASVLLIVISIGFFILMRRASDRYHQEL